MITTTRPTVVCAWCSRMLVEGSAQVSHGICRSCVQALMPDAWADLRLEGTRAATDARSLRQPGAGW